MPILGEPLLYGLECTDKGAKIVDCHWRTHHPSTVNYSHLFTIFDFRGHEISWHFTRGLSDSLNVKALKYHVKYDVQVRQAKTSFILRGKFFSDEIIIRCTMRLR